MSPLWRLSHSKRGVNRRKIEMLLGEIDFRRKRFRCKACSGEFYPLDGALGLEPQRKCTLGVVERALWTATGVSYEKAPDFLKKFTGLEVSRGRIHYLSLKEGRKIQRWEEEERQDVFEEGSELVSSQVNLLRYSISRWVVQV